MLNLYYEIWIDAITRLRSRPENEGMWKFYAVVFIAMAQAINLLLLDVIIERYVFRTSALDIKIHLFHNSRLDGFASFFLLYLLLPLVVNYLLIFRNKRYELLLTRYKSHNGKLAATYIIISYFLPLFLLVVAAALGVD